MQILDILILQFFAGKILCVDCHWIQDFYYYCPPHMLEYFTPAENILATRGALKSKVSAP